MKLKLINFFSVSNIRKLQTLSFQYQSEINQRENRSLADENLHIYIIDSKYPRQSIKTLAQEMEKRTRKDKDCWFIDISALKTMEDTKLMLNNLPLDIDDDIFTFKFVAITLVDIWEIYKIATHDDLIIKKFGVWKTKTGLFSTLFSKWQRRKDLAVSFARIITILLSYCQCLLSGHFFSKTKS